MKDPDDIEAYQQSIERLRVHIFLAGLEEFFEQIRGEILRKDPVPNLEECYSLIRREVVRRTTLKGESENTEASAMVAKNRPNQQERMRPNHHKPTNGVDKSTYKCTHCNQFGHTKNRCFELVGYPERWDHSRDPQKRNSKTIPTAVVVQTRSEDDEASAMVATADKGGKVLNISTPISNSAWIIDSGATDDITFDSRQVSSVNPSLHKFVSTANGNTTPVLGEGSLPLTDSLNLDSVLVVPSLNYNLVSVSQITTALSCVIIFGLIFVCLRTSERRRRLVMVLGRESYTIWTWHQRLQTGYNKL
ncbi:unnamed protein product [Camellia sinensis]